MTTNKETWVSNNIMNIIIAALLGMIVWFVQDGLIQSRSSQEMLQEQVHEWNSRHIDMAEDILEAQRACNEGRSDLEIVKKDVSSNSERIDRNTNDIDIIKRKIK